MSGSRWIEEKDRSSSSEGVTTGFETECKKKEEGNGGKGEKNRAQHGGFWEAFLWNGNERERGRGERPRLCRLEH